MSVFPWGLCWHQDPLCPPPRREAGSTLLGQRLATAEGRLRVCRDVQALSPGSRDRFHATGESGCKPAGLGLPAGGPSVITKVPEAEEAGRTGDQRHGTRERRPLEAGEQTSRSLQKEPVLSTSGLEPRDPFWTLGFRERVNLCLLKPPSLGDS